MMNRLQSRLAKAEAEQKQKAINLALFSMDYYLMALYMAQEKGCVEEMEESKLMIAEIRNDLIRLGHYDKVS